MSSPHPITLLIADDHPIFRRGLRDVIGSDPGLHLVGDAGDGEEAWRLLQQFQPAVAVMDVHMPRVSGIELARLVSEQQLPTAVIILTMDDEEGLLHEALNLGVKGYLLKENAIPELLQAIRRVAGGKEYICPALSSALVRRHAARESLHQQKAGLKRLTPTEQQILRLIADDRTSKEIAELLQCSVRTVETHRQNISHKLELSGSHSLLRFAFDHKAHL